MHTLKQRLFPVLLCLAACTLPAHAALAGGSSHPIEIGLNAGAVMFSSASGLGDAHYKYDVPATSLALGLRGAYLYSPKIAFEGTFRWSSTSFLTPADFDTNSDEFDFAGYKDGGTGTVLGLRALVRYNLLQGDNLNAQPFLTAGLGYDFHTTDKDYVRSGLDGDWAVQVGAGAQFRLNRHFRLRIDASWFVGEPAVERVKGESPAAGQNFEVLAGLTYVIGAADGDGDKDGVADAHDKCPNKAEDRDGFQDADGCPDLDNDGDGIVDTADKCPRRAEDKDGFKDNDGCPEADNDGDGIMDKHDKCPNKAEDKDGYQDGDGCPDADNDRDGIPDAKDRCPNKKEDKDNFQDTDGCPEADNDLDGVPDVKDKCPNKKGVPHEAGCPVKDRDSDGIPDDKDKCPDKAETFNGKDDADGCPDGKNQVVVTKTEIKILQKVFFKRGKSKIQRKSHKVLKAVAAVLTQYKQFKKVTVQGHTDDQGDAAKNRELSQQRAEAVKAFLTKAGVDAGRLSAKGFGPDKPMCKDAAELLKNKRKNRKALKKCRADNRRVEFHIGG